MFIYLRTYRNTVYAQPELNGESEDPEYKRYIPGLGLTKINILPHYQDIRDGQIHPICGEGETLSLPDEA